MRSKPLQVAVKLLVSGTLVAFLARRWGGDPEFREALARLDAAAFAAAVAIVAGGLVLSAMRWRVLLSARGADLPLRRAVRLYFVGYFFNLFLPTSVGGDVVRAVGVKGVPLPVVAGTVLMERILGFGCLLALGLGASLTGPGLAIVRPSLYVAAAVYAAALVALALAPLDRADAGRPGWRGGLLRTAKQLRGSSYPRAALLRAVLLSLGWQLALVAANGVLSDALGGVAPWGALVALVPVIQAVGMLPVSFGGLGVREAGYAFFFARAGYEGAGAVALAAGFLGVTLAVAIAGGVVYLAFPVREDPSAKAAATSPGVVGTPPSVPKNQSK